MCFGLTEVICFLFLTIKHFWSVDFKCSVEELHNCNYIDNMEAALTYLLTAKHVTACSTATPKYEMCLAQLVSWLLLHI